MDSEQAQSPETLYICSSTRSLDFFRINGSEKARFSDPIAKLQNHFPGLEEANLRAYSDSPVAEKWYNVIVGFRKKSIDFLVHDHNRDFYWDWDSVDRTFERKVMQDFLGRQMRIYRTRDRPTDYGIVTETLYNDFKIAGPLLVVVDSSVLSNKKRPTGSYVQWLAERTDFPVDCVHLCEPGHYGRIKRLAYRKLPTDLSLDPPLHKPEGETSREQALLDEVVAEGIQSYHRKMALRNSDTRRKQI